MKNSSHLFLSFYDLLMLCLSFHFYIDFCNFSFKKNAHITIFPSLPPKKMCKCATYFSWTCSYMYTHELSISILVVFVSEGIALLARLWYTYSVSCDLGYDL